VLNQLILQIVDTIDFGRFLILDEMANLAESDTVLYTHNLMNLPHENYKVLSSMCSSAATICTYVEIIRATLHRRSMLKKGWKFSS
jgi:hypothetical protein